MLCAVTFAPSARRVVTWAASLALASGGDVRLFHALAGAGEQVPVEGGADPERLLEKLFALGRHLPGRPRISAAVTEGDAATEIVRHARLMRADLIAVGMHGQDGRVSPLLARLANDAPCPVLAVDNR